MMNPSLYTIKAIFILDNDGQRLVSKYYDESLFESIKEEKEFEKNLFGKTSKSEGEIIMIDNLTIVYRSSIDLHFYVVGSTSENEIMLVSVLTCLFDSISLVLKKNMVEKKYLLDYLDAAFLIINEICDNGILLETDPAQIIQRIGFKESGSSDINSAGISGLLGEQSVMDVVKSARDQLKWSILR
jgi:coatomer subunit zeta